MAPVKKNRRELQRHFLREWREFRQLSQERAASQFDLSRGQLSKIENQKSPYSQGLLERAAEAYNCSVADIIMRNPLDKDAPWSLLDSLKRASPEQRQLAVDVVERLLKTGT